MFSWTDFYSQYKLGLQFQNCTDAVYILGGPSLKNDHMLDINVWQKNKSDLNWSLTKKEIKQTSKNY